MKLEKLLVAGAVAAACTGTFAQNATVNGIDLSSGSSPFSQQKWQNGAFTDTFNFINAPSWADATGTLSTSTFTIGFKDINFLSATLNGNPLTLTSLPLGPNGNAEGGVVLVANLAGPFSITVSGIAVGVSDSARATYSGTLEVTPVPEPETYALMLAGLGAIGYMARRRKV